MPQLPNGLTVARKPLGRFAVCVTLGLCIFSFALDIFYFALPLGSITSDDKGVVVRASFLRENVYRVLQNLPGAACLLLLVAASVLFLRKQRRLSLTCAIASLWIFGTVAAMGPIYLRANWEIMGRVTAPDQSEYFLIAHRKLPGAQLAVARLESTGRMYQTVKLLASPSPYPEIPGIRIIRPTPPKAANPGALLLSPGGQLVWIDFESICNIIYDIDTRHFLNDEEVARTSPFILIDANAALCGPDEAAVLSEIMSTANVQRGLPPAVNTLQQALSHPNPAVRRSAEQMLDAAEVAKNRRLHRERSSGTKPTRS